MRKMTKEEKANELRKTIIAKCHELDVRPEEALDVVGTSVANVMAPLAQFFGWSERKMLQVFGRGIANAEIVALAERGN